MPTNEELCLMAQNGSTAARRQLLDSNMNFYTHIANAVWEANRNQCQSMCIAPEDLLQEGLIKLCDGIDTYRADGGADFLTYIRHVLHNAMVDFLRHEKSSAGPESDLSLDDGNNLYLQPPEDSRFESPGEAIIREEKRQALASAWADLPERQKVYLRYRFGLLGDDPVRTQKDAAQHFFLTSSRGKQLEAEAVRFLRQEYAARPMPGEPYQVLQLEPDETDIAASFDSFLESRNDYDDAAIPESVWDAPRDRSEKLRQELQDSDPFLLAEDL